MSVKTVDRQTRVMKPVRIYTCDGPECSKTVEVPATLKVMEVPPAWIFISDDNGQKHYCSRDCLADAVVP